MISSDIMFILLIVLSVLVVILFAIVIRQHFKIKKFLINIDAHNIADSLNFVSDNMKELHKFSKEVQVYLANVEKRLNKSIRSVHTIRFNPFIGTGEGGNQSFATAFLSESGEGAVISSLYSRDRVSVFSKPIKNFSSEHEMSEEEKQALENAKEKLK